MHGLIDTADNKSRLSVFYYFRDGAAAEGENRRAASHSLDHDKPERLWPINRKQQRRCLAQEFGFVAVVDFSDELDLLAVNQRLDNAAEIFRVCMIYLGREFQFYARSSRDFDSAVRPLFRRHASEECQVAFGGPRRRSEKIRR